jgi:hypothetical protein
MFEREIVEENETFYFYIFSRGVTDFQMVNPDNGEYPYRHFLLCF